MSKPLSIAATVALIRRYVDTASEAKRAELAALLGPAHAALARQCATVYAPTRAAKEQREATPEEARAFLALGIASYISTHLAGIGAWNHWSATLPQRVSAYATHYAPAVAWLNGWPAIKGHIDAMQVGVGTLDAPRMDQAFSSLAHALGGSIALDPAHSTNQPASAPLQRRVQETLEWLRQWPDIRRRIELLLPELDRELLAPIDIVASIPDFLGAPGEAHAPDRA